MLKQEQFTQLFLASAKARANKQCSFSVNGADLPLDKINETIRDTLKEFPGKNAWQKWRNGACDFLLQAIEDTVDELVPPKVFEAYGQIAEIKQVGQGGKAKFVTKVTEQSKRRARRFIGKVGINGLQQAFRVEGKEYEVGTNAIGGAQRVEFEEILDGTVDAGILMELVLQGIDECIYVEIEKYLNAAIQVLQANTTNGKANNYRAGNGFVEKPMDDLLAVADTYGNGNSTIYCTFEFAAKMIPSEGRMSNEQKNTLWNNGYIGNYKGHNVVVVRNSFTDETNRVKQLDPSVAIIVPGAIKPVKIVLEGDTIVKNIESPYDKSSEFHCYKKVGVACELNNDICVYKDTSLSREAQSYEAEGSSDNDLATF